MDWWTQIKEAIPPLVALLGVISAIVGAIWAGIKWGILRQWQKKLRVDVKVFELITDPAVLLPKLYATENDNSLLADHNIKYQPRDPDRDLQGELKATLNRSRYLLITAPTGYGKTREAGLLAQTMILEGWRVLMIRNTGWLDVPKTLPMELKNNRSRVLIFLDDLNGLFSTGERTESPRAEKIPLLSEPSYHDRLLQVLDMLEGMCTKKEIRVIATARSEIDQWNILDFNPRDRLWKRFTRIELPAPVDSAIVNLLDESAKQLTMEGDPKDFATIARKNDGTYRNILLNLRRWDVESKKLSKDDFTETLDGSWREIYENAIKRYIAVKYIYDAIDLLQQMYIWLDSYIVEPTALMLWGGNKLQKLLRKAQIQIAFNYLTNETKILRKTNGEFIPSDGQIEAKGTRLDWTKYVFDVEKLILDLDKRAISNQNLLVAFLLFRLGLRCLERGNLEHTIRIWQKIPSENLHNWFKKIFGFVISVYPGAKSLVHHAVEQKDRLCSLYFLAGLVLEIFDHNIEAEAAYRQIIVKQPDDSYAQTKLGDILRSLKRYSEAEEAYCQAIELNPNYAYTYSRLGSLLRIQERYERAEDAYIKAIAKDPNDIFTYWRFGTLLMILDRFTEAEAIYRQATKINTNDTYYLQEIYSDLGNVLGIQGRYDEAQIAFNNAIELDPSNPDNYKKLIYLLRFERNKGEEALPFLEKLVEIDPSDFLSFLAIASVNKQLGKGLPTDRIEKVRQLMPENDWYNRACLESICNNLDYAFDYLRRAKQADKFKSTWAWKDPDLQWIRDDPRFEDIVGPKPEKKA